jgi:DNA polymerase IV
LGLSVNKLVSKVGTGEAKPNGARLVECGTEKAFLSPLSVGKIPSVGRETFQKLSMMGVRQVGTLAQIPPKLLEREFGKHGVSLWKKANGIDNSPITPYHDRKGISTERTFQTDTIDIGFLKSQLTDMVGRLAFDLRGQKKLTSCISVKIRYTDFNTYSLQKSIPFTAQDGPLLAQAKELFEKLYQRRQLVRLIGVRFTNLVHGHTQISLFENTQEEVSLLAQLDHIRRRFGEGAIMKASAMKNPTKK